MYMRIAIVGYGNLGQGAELALRDCRDCEAVGVFTRRDPAAIRTRTGIPVYPAAFTVNDVLRAAFSSLDKIKARMRQLEKTMTEHTPKEILSEYDALTSRFEAGGGYEIDTETDKICNGLMISQTQREQLFSSLSGGEKTRVNLARLLLEKTDILLLDEPTNHLDMHAVEWLEEYISRFKGRKVSVSCV